MIAYLNGRLRAFVDTTISIVDIADCVEGHLLGAERGVPGERYVLNGATLELAGGTGDRLRAVGRAPPACASCPPAGRQRRRELVEGVFRLRGKQPPVCREMVRTLLHGHRYDGSRATRELGLQYTPVADTFRRTIDWAVGEGLVQQADPHPLNVRACDRGYQQPMEIQTIPPSPEQKRQLREGIRAEARSARGESRS